MGEEIAREFNQDFVFGLCPVPRKQNIWDGPGRENFGPPIASPTVVLRSSWRDVPAPLSRATPAAADKMSQEDDALREVCLFHTHAEGNANCMGGTETQSLLVVLHWQDRRRRNIAIEHQCNTTVYWRSDGDGLVADWYHSHSLRKNNSVLTWRFRKCRHGSRDLFETRGENDRHDRRRAAYYETK
jgi:hypothetical protein